MHTDIIRHTNTHTNTCTHTQNSLSLSRTHAHAHTDAQNESAAGSENRWGARCLNCSSLSQLPSWIYNKLANVDFSAMLQKTASKSASKFWLHTVWFLVMIPIVSHQSVVLLPLTNFNTSPVCSRIETPAGMNTQTTMCLAKWAMAAIPYGVPMCIGGFLCAVACRALADAIEKLDREPIANDREAEGTKGMQCVLALLNIGLSVTGFVLLITGVCMLLFWLYGGVVLGFYFTFASATVLEDLAVVKIFGVVLIALSTTISTLVI
jgi:hypothetical protein